MNEQIKAAKDAYQSAAENLIEVTRQVYPVGTKLNVRIGPHIVTIEVTRHSNAWWSNPGQMFGLNVVTGSRRTFSASQVLEVAP